MAKAGRKSKLTPETKERLLSAIKMGATYEIACNYAGISYQTYLNWKERKEAPYLELFEAIARAEGAAAVKWLALLEQHSTLDPKWAAWKLERRYPHEYGRTVVSNEHKGAVEFIVKYEDAPNG